MSKLNHIKSSLANKTPPDQKIYKTSNPVFLTSWDKKNMEFEIAMLENDILTNKYYLEELA
jgi:hypothetical protein